MSSLLSTVLLVAALGAYCASTLGFVFHLLSKRPGLAQKALVALSLGLVLHGAGKVARFIDLGSFPATNGLEAMSLLALVLGVLFVYVAQHYKVPALGAFATPLVTVTLAASLAFDKSSGVVPDALRSAWFPVHIGLAILGDACFVLAGVVSVAYLIQDHFLRAKRLGPAFRNLPPLHVLDEIVHRLVSVGFLFMTLGIVAGSFYAKNKWHAYWSWDPKQTWTLMTWLLFAGILHGRVTIGWRGRRAAYLTLLAVGCVLLALFGLDVFTATRHGGEYT